jgi:glucose/arabinose dehydrogenase
VKKIIFTVLAVSIVLTSIYLYNDAELRWEVGKSLKIKEGTSPQIVDPNLKIEEVVTGASELTTFAFINNNEIMYLEKINGDVKLIKNSQLQDEPLYHFDVYKTMESGLLGIATHENNVFIYVSEPKDEKGEIPDKNNIYKFLWKDEKLIEKELVNVLPSRNCCHQGGYMVTSPNGKVFATIGDLENIRQGTPGKLQNMIDGEIDDTSIIFEVGFDRNIKSPMTSEDPLSHYYAIGIRNSFGLAFDPLTGNLWDTENGQYCCDEINLVPPKFNSGWALAHGFINQKTIDTIPKIGNFEYSNPEFEWESVVAPTALAFPGNQWGDQYTSSLFVTDYLNGIIYKFELNESRTGFVFEDPSLQDLILNDGDNYDEIIFGAGFGRISDMKFGPDGSLYVASHLSNGALFKISLK